MEPTLLEKFAVGNTVFVREAGSVTRFDGLNTSGMTGCVKKTDYKAGVCVQLFFSRLFMPCFWYQPYYLISTELTVRAPLTWKSIEARIGIVPGEGMLPQNSIIAGALRSWLVSKSNARPGQSIYVLISGMSLSECVDIYEGGDKILRTWLQDNDTRLRRPQLTEQVTDVNVYDKMKGTLSVKRPKIG